jgi:NTE family protein
MVKAAEQAKPRIAFALGSGSARGWAHIGVIRALEKAGVRADIVCGTSIGALVGAAYAAGEIDQLERFVLGLSVADVLGFMDLGPSGGVLKGDRLMDFFRSKVADRPIDALATPFAAVATSLRTGAEVWLREGSTFDAVRASIALPGLFAPVRWAGSLLVDGGLVNPVPVSLGRAMGANIVIAVDLGSDVLGRRFRAAPTAEAQAGAVQRWMRQLQENLSALAEEGCNAVDSGCPEHVHGHHPGPDCAQPHGRRAAGRRGRPPACAPALVRFSPREGSDRRGTARRGARCSQPRPAQRGRGVTAHAPPRGAQKAWIMPSPKPVGSAPRAGSRKICVGVIGELPKVWKAFCSLEIFVATA